MSTRIEKVIERFPALNDAEVVYYKGTKKRVVSLNGKLYDFAETATESLNIRQMATDIDGVILKKQGFGYVVMMDFIKPPYAFLLHPDYHVSRIGFVKTKSRILGWQKDTQEYISINFETLFQDKYRPFVAATTLWERTEE